VQLLSYTAAQPGEYFNGAQIKVGAINIQDAYGYQGQSTTVKPELFYNDKGEVAVQYKVEEKPVAYVGEIKVWGNTTTRQNIILRQLPFYPGQILSYPDLRLGEKNL